MKSRNIYIAIGLMAALGLFFELAAHASELDEQMKLTFSAPVQIPGQVLPAGTYIFERAQPYGNPNIVRIYNADGTLVVATLETVPSERMQPAGDITVTLAKAEPGNPDYLVEWFYSGRTTGHRLLYSKQQKQKIAQASQQTVVANQRMSKEFSAAE